MGPPTISADQQGELLLSHYFVPASMGPPTISADQRYAQALRLRDVVALQWGRRRSRRINSTLQSPLLARVPGRKSRTCASRALLTPSNCPHHTLSAPKNPVPMRNVRISRAPRVFAIDPGSRSSFPQLSPLPKGPIYSSRYLHPAVPFKNTAILSSHDICAPCSPKKQGPHWAPEVSAMPSWNHPRRAPRSRDSRAPRVGSRHASTNCSSSVEPVSAVVDESPPDTTCATSSK